MEINLQGTAIPCIAMQDIVAGMAVQLVASGATVAPIGATFGTGAEDSNAKYIAAFRVFNEVPPLFETFPTKDETGNKSGIAYTLRGWVEGQENLPATVRVRMVAPRLKEEETIPSGTLMLAYDEGIYTVTSGAFTGTGFEIGDAVTAGSDGKWQAFSSKGRVATCFDYDSVAGTLTIKIE